MSDDVSPPAELAAVMARLETSALFDGTVAERRRYDHAAFAKLTQAEVLASMERGIVANAAVKNWSALVKDVRALGRARHAPAVPLLRRLWETCALQPIQVAAGHALRTIDTRESREALRASIEDSFHLSTNLAVRATFAEDERAAFDVLTPYFDAARRSGPGGNAIPHGILAFFCPTSFTNEGAGWTDPRAPGIFREDLRWMDLCVELRHDEALGGVARRALRHGHKSAVDVALARARVREGTRTTLIATAARGDLVSRYQCGDRGERAAVWVELRELGALGGDLREEANAVARATMEVVRHNVIRWSRRLEAAGWKTRTGWLHSPPTPADAAILVAVEQRTEAPLPPSLRAFWEVVGGINGVWDYDLEKAAPDFGTGIDLTAMDPLCVDGPDHALDEVSDGEGERQGHDPEICEPFSISLAPDALHKANISGGGPYGIELPFLGADPIFGNAETSRPFVDYLRDALLTWAGFPLLFSVTSGPALPRVRAFVADLTSELEPF